MGKEAKGFGFKKFATPRIIGGIVIVVIVLWALAIIFGPSESLSPQHHRTAGHDSAAATAHKDAADTGHAPAAKTAPAQSHAVATASKTEDSHAAATHTPPSSQAHSGTSREEADRGQHGATREQAAAHQPADSHATPATQVAASQGSTAAGHSQAGPQPTTADKHAQAAAGHSQARPEPAAADKHGTDAGHATAGHAAAETGAAGHGTVAGHPIDTPPAHKPMPKGVAFVEATIKPMQYELEERWWGWRPNDLVDVTDNVNNFQLGVLEVTRRTTVALGERISRHGTTDAFDENLENAMNWFMVKATSYWFPSAESKYSDGLEELAIYLEKLKAGEATFYTRTDNLIPLLASFEDLLGSCDENLVKQTNEDGSPVSFFAVDNYFYYTQGVASAMASVLEAVHHDFLLTLESRNGTELLHHAIESCHWAGQLDPWMILNRDLDSIFANHRANMAAPISHAGFYLRVLIKTLST